MTWYQADAYCRWLGKQLSKHEQFPEGMRLARLPLESEWEYACRANSQTEFYTGDGVVALKEAGWFGENWDAGSTHPAGDPLKQPNAFGLQDMHGNVWEWCQDRWDRSAYRRRWDGITAEQTFELNQRFGDENNRVLRGGSWITADNCRAAVRFWDRAGYSFRFRGLRVCLVPSPNSH